jgi:hypothetical protein
MGLKGYRLWVMATGYGFVMAIGYGLRVNLIQPAEPHHAVNELDEVVRALGLLLPRCSAAGCI